ncbi:MAG: hypothetical protein E7411_08010 [Ruminococcaceae bacterium]|nr:hypothetical protein [Oscillospiraceae bacterium]
MDFLAKVLDKNERILYTLRKLYMDSGYKKYRMSKFEEYDLYVKNKDFLVSSNVITFNDIDGKLMALKPDVTLSIIKNTGDCIDGVQKLFYNENVYRASNETQSFKEIMQTGVECIGNIDNKCICENIILAAQSLNMIKDKFILDISHLGIIEKVTGLLNLSENGKKSILKAFGEKNTAYVDEILNFEGIDTKEGNALKTLIKTYGSFSEIISKLKIEAFSSLIEEEIELLEEIAVSLEKNGLSDKVRLDFSVINNMSYYNGIAFNGFISGIPEGVLSGGQYDKLMNKMGKKSRAIGFAVYLDVLDRM